jgi:hypothetical protein
VLKPETLQPALYCQEVGLAEWLTRWIGGASISQLS